MKQYFQKSRIVFRLGIAATIVLTVALSFFLMLTVPDQEVLIAGCFVFVLLGGYLLTVYLVRRANGKELYKLTAILTDQCDPEEFIQAYTPWVYHNHAQPADAPAIGLYFLGVGYVEKDELVYASQTLLSAIRPENNLGITCTNGLVYCALATVANRQGDRASAAQYFQQARYALERLSGSPKLYRSLASIIESRRYLLFPQEEGLSADDCIRYWEQELQAPRLSRYNTVNMHWNLAKLFSEAGDSAKAAEHARFVTEHGNKLSCVPKARELLSSLGRLDEKQ